MLNVEGEGAMGRASSRDLEGVEGVEGEGAMGRASPEAGAGVGVGVGDEAEPRVLRRLVTA